MNKFYASLKGICFLMLMMNTAVGFGQPGFLDATFGNGGKVVTAIDSFSLLASELRIQPDGKIVAVGRVQMTGGALLNGFVVVRYNDDGTLDNTFGSGGKVINHFNSANQREASQTLNIQPDGKIIVGGTTTTSTSDMVLVRYNNNGTIDNSFGSNGLSVADFGSSDYTYTTLLKPDGKIITAGASYGFPQALLIQYTPNGLRDSSFGINGVAISPAYSGINNYLNVNGLAIQTNGNILVGGYSTKFDAIRFLPNGTIDSSYGDNGRARINLLGSSYYLNLQQDGKAILSGTTFLNNHNQIALVRVNTNGLLDSSFGTAGIVITDIDTAKGFSFQSFIQPDGKILVAGTNSLGGGVIPNLPANGYRGDFVLLRYNSDGTIDSSFGVQGIITTDFGLQDNAASLAVQSDGKVILAGRVSDSTKYNIGLARYSFNALPLHLLTFTAKRVNTSNLLTWSTAQEINTDRFEIERSSNSREFSKIGVVSSVSAIGSTHKYSFTDYSPLTTAHSLYYRLKMLDKDGQFTYSPIRQININHSTFNIALFPNPAKDNMQLQIESDKQKTINLQVVSQDGKIVLSKDVTVQQGVSLQNINISKLASGHYFLKVIGETIVLKFEKL